VFEVNFGLKSKLDRPVLIFIPDSPFDFEQISPAKHAGGYFVGAPWRDLIALRELFRARTGLLHEYTHLVLRHEGGRYPAWFQEGTAEYYSTLRVAKDGVEAGVPDPMRSVSLRKGAWVPISYLVTPGAASELPSLDAMQRYYAQSWLYVNMLHTAPAYREAFPRIRMLLAEGTSTEDALQRVYGKTLSEFDNDARAWFAGNRFPPERLRAPPHQPPQIEEKVIGEIEVEIARITVAASGPGRAKAAQAYAQFHRKAGDRCDLQAALGDLAHSAGLLREAADRYRESAKCGGGNTAAMAQGLAETFAYRSDVTKEEIDTVVSLGAGGRHGYLIGTGLFFSRDYEGALRSFDKISKLNSYDEFRMTRMKAIALSNLNRFDEAQAAAERLRSLSGDEDQRQNARLTAEDVQRARERAEASPDPERSRQAVLALYTRLEGVLTRVDCMGDRARFWVRSGAETKKVLIADPGEVVTGPKFGRPLEFGCGAQSRRVVIGYQPKPDAATDTAGRIRYVEFR